MPRELGVRKLTAFPLETEGAYGGSNSIKELCFFKNNK